MPAAKQSKASAAVQPEPEVEKTPGQPPAFKVNSGSVWMSVWENEHTTSEGKAQTWRNAKFERNYQKDGDWHTTTQMREQDWGHMITAIQMAQQKLATVDD